MARRVSWSGNFRKNVQVTAVFLRRGGINGEDPWCRFIWLSVRSKRSIPVDNLKSTLKCVWFFLVTCISSLKYNSHEYLVCMMEDCEIYMS